LLDIILLVSVIVLINVGVFLAIWVPTKRFIVKPEDEPESNVLQMEYSPYRLHRIIRSKYRHGDFTVVNEHLHHYMFIVDDEPIVIGIVGLNGILDELKQKGL
jgi:hypothetical protein